MMYLGNEKVSIVDIIEKKFNFTSLNNGGFVRYNEALDAFDTVLPDDQLNALSDNVVKNSVVTLELAQKANRDELPDVSQFITKDVNNLINYTTTEELVVLLEDKIDEELADYVKNTDYATSTKGGVVKVNGLNGLQMYEGSLTTNYATKEDMNYQENTWKPVTPKFLAYGVKRALIEPEKSPTPANWTEEEKASVRNLIEVVKLDTETHKWLAGAQTAYGTSYDGEGNPTPGTIYIATTPTSGRVARWSDNKTLKTNTPTTDNDAANKLYVDEQISEVREVAEGKTKSFTIDTLSDLGTLLGIDTSVVADEYVITSTTITYKEQSIELKQGDLFLIVDTNVPDYWVSVDDMKLYKMETTKVDLTEYVKNTDYASADKAGVVKVGDTINGINIDEKGTIYLQPATNANIDQKTSYRPITPMRIDYAVKKGLTTNTETLTDEEKEAASEWLGTLKAVKDVTTWQQIYGKGADGNQQMFNAHGMENAYTIPIRQANGVIYVGTPTDNRHATTKEYVDNIKTEVESKIPTFAATQLEDGSYSLTIGG